MNAESNLSPQPQTYAQQKLKELLAGKKPVPAKLEDLFAPDLWPEDDIEEFLTWLDDCRQNNR